MTLRVMAQPRDYLFGNVLGVESLVLTIDSQDDDQMKIPTSAWTATRQRRRVRRWLYLQNNMRSGDPTINRSSEYNCSRFADIVDKAFTHETFHAYPALVAKVPVKDNLGDVVTEMDKWC